MDDDEPLDSENWVDLAVDQTATAFGRLDSVGYGNPGTICMTFSDWTQLVVETDRPRDINKELFPLGSHVLVRCRRTEDGLYATAIWKPGGPPIALV